MCQSLGGVRLDRAVTQAFLEAVTPAGISACTEAIGQIEAQHAERLAGRRLAVERALFETERRQRQYDACEPENRLVARTLEARLEEALVTLERERRALIELEQRRPEPRARPSLTTRGSCRGCGTRRRPPPASARSCSAR
jgi:hypothetical protein